LRSRGGEKEKKKKSSDFQRKKKEGRGKVLTRRDKTGASGGVFLSRKKFSPPILGLLGLTSAEDAKKLWAAKEIDKEASPCPAHKKIWESICQPGSSKNQEKKGRGEKARDGCRN